MKLIGVFLFLITLQCVYAQQTDTISTEVKAFWDIVNENARHKEENKSCNNPRTESEIKDIAVKLYTATEKDPYGFDKYIQSEFQKYLDSAKYNSAAEYAGFKKQLLIDELNKVYEKKYGEILETPFFIRGKLIGRSEGIHEIKEGRKHRKITLEFVIEDILKGKKYLHVGDHIEVKYLSFWVEIPEAEADLRNYDDFFIALQIWGYDRNEFCPQFYNSAFFAIYPIKDGNIIIRDDIYNLGKNLEWKKFTNVFQREYILDGELHDAIK